MFYLLQYIVLYKKYCMEYLPIKRTILLINFTLFLLANMKFQEKNWKNYVYTHISYIIKDKYIFFRVTHLEQKKKTINIL